MLGPHHATACSPQACPSLVAPLKTVPLVNVCGPFFGGGGRGGVFFNLHGSQPNKRRHWHYADMEDAPPDDRDPLMEYCTMEGGGALIQNLDKHVLLVESAVS